MNLSVWCAGRLLTRFAEDLAGASMTLYSGEPPPRADARLVDNIGLATFILNKPAYDKITYEVDFAIFRASFLSTTVVATGTGTPRFARLVTADGLTEIADLTVSDKAGDDIDVVLDSLTIHSGGKVVCSFAEFFLPI